VLAQHTFEIYCVSISNYGDILVLGKPQFVKKRTVFLKICSTLASSFKDVLGALEHGLEVWIKFENLFLINLCGQYFQLFVGLGYFGEVSEPLLALGESVL